MFEQKRFSQRQKDSHRINNQIRITQIMVIDQEGHNLGVMTSDKARYLARQVELDLVEVAPQARPPVCRIMDYGKFKYEESVKQKKTKAPKVQIKELRLRPSIGVADIDIKIKAIQRFIECGDKVLIKVQFKKRENEHKNLGFAVINKILEAVADIAGPKSPPSLNGNSLSCILEPKKN